MTTKIFATYVFPEQAAAATPASGSVAFYAKSDGRFYGKDDAGTEFLAGMPTQIAGNVDVLAGLVTQGLRAASSNPPLNLGSGAITAGGSTFSGTTTATQLNSGTDGVGSVGLFRSGSGSGSGSGDRFEMAVPGAYSWVLKTATTLSNGDTFQIFGGNSRRFEIQSDGKMGFFGIAGVAQPAGSTDVLASLVTLGLRAASSNPPLNLGTGAFTGGSLTISQGAVDISATINANAGQNRQIIFQSAASNRWIIRVNSTAESGSDVGSDLEFVSRTDAGSLKTGVLQLIRSSGAAIFAGLVSTPASATGTAGLRVPHGTAPSAPTDGDIWTTTSGLFARINGVTVGPYAGAGGFASLTADNTWSDGVDFTLGSTNGSMFGTATTQKLAFWGATPIVQITGSTDILAGLVSVGLRAASSNPPLNMGSGTLTAGAATFSVSLVVSAGNFQLDAQGRGSYGGAAVNTAVALQVGGTSAHPGTATDLFGITSNSTAPSTNTGNNWGFYGQPRTAASAFTVANFTTFFADTPILGAGSSITSTRGLNVANQGLTGVTNALGIDVAAQSGASTLNIGARLSGGTQANLWLNSDVATAAGGITLGTGRDTNIYRAAAGRVGMNGLEVTGGDFRVDAEGRIALGGSAIRTDMLIDYEIAHPGTATNLYGIGFVPVLPATTTSSYIGISSGVATVASAFTVVDVYGFYTWQPTVGAGSAITNSYGVKINNAGVTGVTNAYGLDIAAQSGAATLNIAARLSGGTTANLWLKSNTATEAGGIGFGSTLDTSLSRNAAGILQIGGVGGANSQVIVTDGAIADGQMATHRSGAPGGIEWADALSSATQIQVIKNPGAATVTAVGTAAPTLTATPSSTDGADGPWLTSSTTSTSGNASGIISAFTVVQSSWLPEITMRIKTGASITAIRILCGLFSASPDGNVTPAIHYVAFRYAPAVDGTAFWRAVSDNGSGTPTATATSQSIAANTVYVLRISFRQSDGAAMYYINGSLVATHTTTLPTTTTLLGYGTRVVTVTNAIKTLLTGRIALSYV